MSNIESIGFNYNSGQENYGNNGSLTSENYETISDVPDQAPEPNFFDDLMAEVDAEPTGGAGGPNSMFFRYNQLAKEYNTIDKNMANRIRVHGKQKVKETFPNQFGGKTIRKRRSMKTRKNKKQRSYRKRY